MQTARRSWWGWLSLWTGVGLAIRIGTVLGRPHRKPGGDAYFYHYAANLLVSGKGFIDPFIYLAHVPHESIKSAAFPPGFVFVLSAAALVGFKSFFAQRIWCCIIGAAAVTACGITGREIAGERVGLITAFLIAVYPNVWMNDELAMSETLSPLLVALVILAAYRFWKRPTWRTSAWLGLAIGASALARDELSLLGLFIFVPLVLLAKDTRRMLLLAAGAGAAVLVVGPWIGYNLTRFKDPVFISTGLGVTLASSNCQSVYNGSSEGYWSFDCAHAAPINQHADESVQSSEATSYALRFIGSHEDRILPVELARFGRAFGLFHPIQQIHLDSMIETRPYEWALVGLGMYYAMLPVSVGGLVLLRRRKVPVFPLLAVGLTVLVAITLSFGDTRYRSTFEVSLVLLSAVQLEWLWARLATRARSPEPATVAELSPVGAG